MCNIPHDISRQLRDYAMACDTHDWPRLAALFERGKFHFATEAGPEAVLRWGREVIRPGARTQHVISTVHVDVDDEAGTASGTCYLTLFHHSDEDIQLVSACYFENEWMREDGRWWWREHRIVPLFRGDSARVHAQQQFPSAATEPVTGAPAS